MNYTEARRLINRVWGSEDVPGTEASAHQMMRQLIRDAHRIEYQGGKKIDLFRFHIGAIEVCDHYFRGLLYINRSFYYRALEEVSAGQDVNRIHDNRKRREEALRVTGLRVQTWLNLHASEIGDTDPTVDNVFYLPYRTKREVYLDYIHELVGPLGDDRSQYQKDDHGYSCSESYFIRTWLESVLFKD